MLSRRGFLGAAGALIVLGGCGVDEAREEPPTDADVLTGLLGVERRAGAPVVGLPEAELLARQDAAHAQRLAAAAGVADDGPAGTTLTLQDAFARKQEAVFAYVQALPRLADADHRLLVMQIAGSEAEQLVLIRAALGEPLVPDAFAGFTVEDT